MKTKRSSRQKIADECAAICDDLASTSDGNIGVALRNAATIIRSKVGPAIRSGDSHLRAFNEWRANNPNVIALINDSIEMLIRQGRKYYGMQAIMETIRWHTNLETSDHYNPEFKINSSHTSYLVREWLLLNPHRRQMFELRALSSLDDTAHYESLGLFTNGHQESDGGEEGDDMDARQHDARSLAAAIADIQVMAGDESPLHQP